MVIPWQSWADNPDPAVAVAGHALSGAQLVAATITVADRVREFGVAAVHATSTVETVVAVTGCLQAGVPCVPVPADAGHREREHIVRDSGAQLWISSGAGGAAHPQGGYAGLPHLALQVDARAQGGVRFTLHPAAQAGPGHRVASAGTQPGVAPPTEGTAIILYTSGTTGSPKGAMLSGRAIAACLDGLAQAWDWTAQDVLVHGLPLFHVHGLILGIVGPLRLGGSVWHPGRATPDGYAAGAAAGGSLFFGVPTIWSRVAGDAAAAAELRGARLLVSGSASLPGPVARHLAQATGQQPVERYGMTETLITLAARAAETRRLGWVGRELAGVHARVVDEAGAAVPADGDTVGDLQVRGATLFDGYLNRPEQTAQAWTPDGWFRTGDVAAHDADGWFRIAGRKATDLIKCGGYRIGAGEVEDCLLDHPGVHEVAVVGVPDDDLGQRIVAYVVPTETPGSPSSGGHQTAEAALIDHVSQALSGHKRPREVRFVSELPRNEMGKVLKSQLGES